MATTRSPCVALLWDCPPAPFVFNLEDVVKTILVTLGDKFRSRVCIPQGALIYVNPPTPGYKSPADSPARRSAAGSGAKRTSAARGRKSPGTGAAKTSRSGGKKR